MRIHKEGRTFILLSMLLAMIAIGTIYTLASHLLLPFSILIAILLFLIIYFFRDPDREILLPDNNKVFAPADGRIVAIEKVNESEYFNDERIQVSIFMSPINVHVNRNPISGQVNYFKHHPGKYLVAWHPKSSTENERTTVVIEHQGTEILLRQIAGFLAKRIVNYLDEGEEVEQGEDMGFIKFGSRVDLFLPLNAQIQVGMNEKVKGNRSIIATF